MKGKERKGKLASLRSLFPEAVDTDNCHLLGQVIHVKTGRLTGL